MNYSAAEKTKMLNLLNLIQPTGTTTVSIDETINNKLITSLMKYGYIMAAAENIQLSGLVNAWDIKITFKGETVVKVGSFDNLPMYLKEFPDFDHVPAMESTLHDTWYGDSTWEDNSYHNDVCPNFTSEDIIAGKFVKIWTDYKNVDLRETDHGGLYMIAIHDKCEDGSEGDHLEDVLHTDNIDDVYKWILGQECKNEIARREVEAEKNKLADLKMKGLRAPTIEDMIATKKISKDLDTDLSAGVAELENVFGFIYFNSYYIEITKTGQFMTTASNDGILCDTLNEAEIWLWDNWVCGEADPIEIPMSAIDMLLIEYKQFLKANGLPTMSADELAVQTKPHSDNYIANQWQRNYLNDFVWRWEKAIRA